MNMSCLVGDDGCDGIETGLVEAMPGSLELCEIKHSVSRDL